MALPKRSIEIGDDDIQDVENDIEKLKAKYLTPVDNLRSFAKPGPVFSNQSGAEFKGMQTDNLRPLESRAHAFYRYVGFPVATPDGFYNPGHQPGGQFLSEVGGTNDVARAKANVDEKFQNSQFIEIVNDREELHEINRSVFARRDLNSSLYAILLREKPPFQVLDENKGPFDIDKQNFEVSIRRTSALGFFSENTNLEESQVSFLQEIIGPSFSNGRKILRPFVVNPRIEITTQPDRNRIAVPFLSDKEALVVEKKGKTPISVKRPGIEFIIRERLRKSSDEAVEFLENIEKIANNDVSPSSFTAPEGKQPQVPIDVVTLRNFVEAVLGDNDINPVSVLELQGITTVQVKVISNLVKTIKSVINQLIRSMKIIDEARSIINWVPFPSVDGPEQGARGARLNLDKISTDLNPLDDYIKKLRLKELVEKHRISQETDLGEFAYPGSASIKDSNLSKIRKELNKRTRQRNDIANGAFQAMGRIDTITGEVSGLGLIDVLCIYVALWSMNERSLISMLDDDAFARLVDNFPDLVVGAAANRDILGEKENIEVALGNFEQKLINVLTFADNEYGRQFLAPGEKSGGNISADS